MADSAELTALEAVVADTDHSVLLPKGAAAADFLTKLMALVAALDARVDTLENP